MSDPSLACRFEAFAVALMARSGPVPRPRIAALQGLAAQLPPDAVMVRAVSAFAAVWNASRRDGDKMYLAGAALLRDIERASWPSPHNRGEAA